MNKPLPLETEILFLEQAITRYQNQLERLKTKLAEQNARREKFRSENKS